MPLRSPNTPRKPRILLVPPPELPVPAVQGGAVETLVTHLIRENERAGKLDLLCASIPDPEAAAQAQGLQHTKMLYVAKPRGVRRYYPMVFLERCFGVAAPYDPWYQKVQLSLALELPTPDLIVAEGGTLTQCSAISKMFGKRRCLAHLHGQTSCSHEMDAIYGGILALSEFIRDDYLKTSELDRKHAYILHNCIDTARFVPGPADAALRASLGFAPEDFVVLFCGRLEPDKGIHKLLEAMENIHDPRIKLLIVGSPFLAVPSKARFCASWNSRPRPLATGCALLAMCPMIRCRNITAWRTLSACPPWWRKPPGLWRWKPWAAADRCLPPAAAVCRNIWTAARPCWWTVTAM